MCLASDFSGHLINKLINYSPVFTYWFICVLNPKVTVAGEARFGVRVIEKHTHILGQWPEVKMKVRCSLLAEKGWDEVKEKRACVRGQHYDTPDGLSFTAILSSPTHLTNSLLLRSPHAIHFEFPRFKYKQSWRFSSLIQYKLQWCNK